MDLRRLGACALLLLLLASPLATASDSEPAYRLEKVAEGVYCATSTETA
jgi:hypothetical protein